jgi:AbrB family looped-hinge helix DNA binding protein
VGTTGLTTTLSRKGQVTLPRAVRVRLHWRPGTRLAVVETAKGILLCATAAGFPPTRPEDVFGCLAHRGGVRSVAQMDAAITIDVRRRAGIPIATP